jgi:hypothetical protein
MRRNKNTRVSWNHLSLGHVGASPSPPTFDNNPKTKNSLVFYGEGKDMA